MIFCVKTSDRDLFPNFRETFAKFSHLFRGLCELFEVFGLPWTCSDAFGCIGMRSDAVMCIRIILENIENKSWTKILVHAGMASGSAFGPLLGALVHMCGSSRRGGGTPISL